MPDERLHLRVAFRRIKRLRAALRNITHAVELRRHAPQPERMQRLEFAGLRLRVERLGTTVNAQRTPVKPPFFEQLRNSMAHSRAPGIS